jgi:2-oxoglutarate dehydrogenase E1 component
LSDLWHEFYGPNAGYLLELYERFRTDPSSVPAEIRVFFKANPAPAELLNPQNAAYPAAFNPSPPSADPQKVAGVLKLAQAIRWYGHWAAALDPLGTPPPGDPSLILETYGLTETDLRRLPASLVGGGAAQGAENALEAVAALRRIYSGFVGHDYLQIRDAQERDWLREAAESGRYCVNCDPPDPLEVLKRLTEVEVFEDFLQRSFVAKTRFSIEGLDMLVLLMDEIIKQAAETGIFNILIGMAHRGRLNLLAHVLQKPIDQILAEFKDPLRRRSMQNEPDGWSGDVKYHAGARRSIDTDNDPSTVELFVQMAPNPSHLEAVNPVVEGMARAAGTRTAQPGPAVFDPAVTLPVLIHGDAAFPGQGVVAETLNLYRLPGYHTGGTIHIIANNQIGFTTAASETRSTLFASDLAKGFRIPIIHVNADDPEGVIMAARIAFAYRERFHNDFLIDLIGYRRLGHNEGDEPAFTQPLMYKRIETHPSVRKIWAERLGQEGLISAQEADRLYQDGMNALQAVLDGLTPDSLREPIPPPPPPGAARKVYTAVGAERLKRLNQELQRVPQGFRVHPRLERIRQRREKIMDDPAASIDWSAAEELAFATILEDGTPIRLTGQDCERGTFSHRHAVLSDFMTGEKFTPLHAISSARASFEVRNSPLSEYAALGFEFGYNIQAPSHLVIWEAQYGDFINNAQTVIDEFITSARDKWGQLPSLVLLLPHGYEGQGPDHSSARLERFLGLAAEKNLRVVNCTSSANLFHVLRRQAALLSVDPLPLVIMTPKSLLRHPLVSAPLRDFSEGSWRPVIDRCALGDQPLPPAAKIRRLIVCSGKIYVDLVSSELAAQHPEIGVARLEQLAPFPSGEVHELFASYPALKEILWVQEEPENMGAAEFVRSFLEEAAGSRASLRIMARPSSASPAEGSNNLHAFNQRSLIEQAFAPLEVLPKRGPRLAHRARPAQATSK